MVFDYTLERDEYFNFCKYQVYADRDIRKLRLRAMPILPVALVLLLAVFRPTHWAFYAAGALLALLWVLLVNRMVARIIVTEAKKRSDAAPDSAFRPVHLELEEGALKVNGSKQRLVSYRAFTNLILLFLEEDSTVILPARVIGGEDEAHLLPVMEALGKCMKKD